MPPSQGFADRIIDIVLGAEQIFGSGRSAAEFLGIPRSTFQDIASGVTSNPSQGTIDRIASNLAALTGPNPGAGPDIGFAIQSAADIFAGSPPDEKQTLRLEFRNDPAFFQEALDVSRGQWIEQQQARQTQGLPPLVGHSA